MQALSGNFPVLGIYKNPKCRSTMSTLGREGEGRNMNTGIDKYPHHHGDTYKDTSRNKFRNIPTGICFKELLPRSLKEYKSYNNMVKIEHVTWKRI